MEFVWIIFTWVVLLIIYYTWKWGKEKKEKMIISRAGMRKYNKPMSMSIGRRIKYKIKKGGKVN